MTRRTGNPGLQRRLCPRIRCPLRLSFRYWQRRSYLPVSPSRLGGRLRVHRIRYLPPRLLRGHRRPYSRNHSRKVSVRWKFRPQVLLDFPFIEHCEQVSSGPGSLRRTDARETRRGTRFVTRPLTKGAFGPPKRLGLDPRLEKT